MIRQDKSNIEDVIAKQHRKLCCPTSATSKISVQSRYLKNALEMQLGGAHGVSGQQVQGCLAVLVAHVGHGSVLQQQLGVLGFLQHAGKVQRCIAHGALQKDNMSCVHINIGCKQRENDSVMFTVQSAFTLYDKKAQNSFINSHLELQGSVGVSTATQKGRQNGRGRQIHRIEQRCESGLEK